MDCINDPSVPTIVFMKPAQVGWTELLCNVAGYFIDQDPCPMLVIQPTLEMAKTWSKDRFAPMLRDTPVLKGKVKDARSRDADNTTLHKRFQGGHITIIGANSPSGLASRPIRVVLYDEVDRYPESAGTEGDPIDLGRKRTTTFWNRKLVLGSTPTIEGASRISLAYKNSDQREYHVPCPHCRQLQVLKFSQIKFNKEKPEDAIYICEHCDGIITDHDKQLMLANGRWIAKKPFRGVAGFWINGLYSPWLRFGEIAQEFLIAKQNPETLQVFVNTVLGETWIEKGDAPKLEDMRKLKDPYPSGSVPVDARILTCGVDVQKERLIFAVRGWGAGSSSWLIEHGEFWGNTAESEVWDQLSGLLDRDYGDGLGIRRMLVDSGYRPDMTYSFCRKHPNALATKGRDDMEKPVSMSKIEVTGRGKVIGASQQLWHINTNYFKSWVHGRIRWAPDVVGAWRLCEDTTDDYCEQIIAESKIINPTNGKVTWKRHSKENHYLDCEVLNAAAAQVLGVRFIKPQDIEQKQVKTEQKNDSSTEASPPLAPATGDAHTNRGRRGSGYLPRRRGFLKR